MARIHPLFPYYFYLLVIFLHQTHLSIELPDSQHQAILHIQLLLNYPPSLRTLGTTTDFCSIEPSPYLRIACYEDNVTQAHFHGINGVSPLPESFSIDAFFEALAALPSLKVLNLVSLGLWGPLPPNIGNLTSLEMLNLSSNYLNGTLPVEITGMRNLQSLVLDHNSISGSVPSWFGTIHGLSVLSLKNNSLSGRVPDSLSGLVNLRILELSINNLTGELPDLSNLTSLQVLDIANNSLGPHFPRLHNKVVTLVLRSNRFRFGMTDDISTYYQLQKLDLSSNDFVGPFTPSLLGMPSIRYLDIARNKFTGNLIDNMSCGAELESVNLSSNLLTGALPNCLRLHPKVKALRYRGNCLSGGGQVQHPYSFCHNEALAVKIMPPDKEKDRSSGSKTVLAMSTVGGTLGGLSLVGLIFLFARTVFPRNYFKKTRTRLILEKVSPKYTARQFSNAREICQMVKFASLGLPSYKNFALEELQEATENFGKSSLIGEGTHGPIYKGKLFDGAIVAIRGLTMQRKRAIHAYTHHIEFISKLRHSHLVSALGYCFECYPDESAVSRIYLVFEFIPNGTLRDCIAGKKFSWSHRITSAIGVAKGIQFLHTGIMPGLFCNNLKITNILVDSSLHVKLSSYNLPLLAENRVRGDGSGSSSGSKGNIKAIGKQEERSDREKSDIYEFGVILLEIIAGRAITSAADITVSKDLFQVALKADKIARKNVADPVICKECSDDSLRTLMELSINCLSSDIENRPSIEDVLWNLQFAAQVQDSWQGDPPSEKGSPILCSS